MALNQVGYETLAAQVKEDDAAYLEWLESLKNPDGSWSAGFRSPDVTELAGITFRQTDYWARRGVLIPEIQDAQGSGSQRVYSFEDVCRAALLSRLVRGGKEGWGLSLEKASGVVDRIRESGGQVCAAAGVIAPSPNYDGPLLFEQEIPQELVERGFVVIGRPDVRDLASRALSKTVRVLPIN